MERLGVSEMPASAVLSRGLFERLEVREMPGVLLRGWE